MGGTTAKMCLIEGGHPRITHEFEAGRLDRFRPGSGLPLKLMVVDMIEIGAGGGSIAAVDELGLMKVGPRSAGAVPGPVAYRRGGQDPTVTDADLLVGYLDPEYFLGGEMALSLQEVEHAVESKLAKPLVLSSRAIAVGIEEIVTQNMAAATRMHLAEKGRDPRQYCLMAVGGAGPAHAYALAKQLHVRRLIVPMGAGVISAFGFLVAAPAVDEVRGYATPLQKVNWDRVAGLYHHMEARARDLLLRAGGLEEAIVLTRSADMRYIGQGFEIEVPLAPELLGAGNEDAIEAAFAEAYSGVFGRKIHDVPAEMIQWRLAARLPERNISLAYRLAEASSERGERIINVAGFGDCRAVVYNRYALPPGTRIQGPAVFEERECSFIVGPDCLVTIDASFNLIAEISA
jgi:N-methylhydantoinase A